MLASRSLYYSLRCSPGLSYNLSFFNQNRMMRYNIADFNEKVSNTFNANEYKTNLKFLNSFSKEQQQLETIKRNKVLVNNQKSRHKQLLGDINRRIEISPETGEDQQEIMSCIIQAGETDQSVEYWSLWIKYLKKFPHTRLNFRVIGLNSVDQDKVLEEIKFQKRSAHVRDIIYKFTELRPEIKAPEKAETAKNITRSDINLIKPIDHNMNTTLEDDDILMFLKTEVRAHHDGYAPAQIKYANYYLTSYPVMTYWWYGRAAQNGHAQGLFGKGFLYEFGHGLKKIDISSAKMFYKRATKRGYPPAIASLGTIIRESHPDVAIKFFEISATRGCLDGLCNLALCYLNGIGTYKDTINAVKMFSVGTKYNHAASFYHLGNCAALGLGMSQHLSLAVKYWSMGAKYGCEESAFNLAKCFYEGVTIPKNKQKAFYWFDKSSSRSHPFASFWLGVCYRKGEGTKVNEEKALECFTKAAMLGKYLQKDMKVLLHSSLKEQNFDLGLVENIE